MLLQHYIHLKVGNLNSNIHQLLDAYTITNGYRFIFKLDDNDYTMYMDLMTSNGDMFITLKNAQGQNVYNKQFRPV